MTEKYQHTNDDVFMAMYIELVILKIIVVLILNVLTKGKTSKFFKYESNNDNKKLFNVAMA